MRDPRSMNDNEFYRYTAWREGWDRRGLPRHDHVELSDEDRALYAHCFPESVAELEKAAPFEGRSEMSRQAQADWDDLWARIAARNKHLPFENRVALFGQEAALASESADLPTESPDRAKTQKRAELAEAALGDDEFYETVARKQGWSPEPDEAQTAEPALTLTSCRLDGDEWSCTDKPVTRAELVASEAPRSVEVGTVDWS